MLCVVLAKSLRLHLVHQWRQPRVEVKRLEGAVALGLEACDVKCRNAVRGACQEAPRVCVSKSTSISVSSDELRIKEACYGTTRF